MRALLNDKKGDASEFQGTKVTQVTVGKGLPSQWLRIQHSHCSGTSLIPGQVNLHGVGIAQTFFKNLKKTPQFPGRLSQLPQDFPHCTLYLPSCHMLNSR